MDPAGILMAIVLIVVVVGTLILLYLIVKIQKEVKEYKRNRQITAEDAKLSRIDYNQSSDNVE